MSKRKSHSNYSLYAETQNIPKKSQNDIDDSNNEEDEYEAEDKEDEKQSNIKLIKTLEKKLEDKTTKLIEKAALLVAAKKEVTKLEYIKQSFSN